MTDPFHPDPWPRREPPPDLPSIEQRRTPSRTTCGVLEHGFERPTWLDIDRLASAGAPRGAPGTLRRTRSTSPRLTPPWR
jgi:hypothetical protein